MSSVITHSSSFLENVLPYLQKQSKGSYIKLAVLIVFLQQTYSYFTPPKQLRQFPRISFFGTIKSFYINESVGDRFRRFVLPLIKSGHGFYVSRLPSDWAVYVTDPVAAKQLFMKTDNFPKSHAILEKLGETSPIVQFIGNDNVAMSNGSTWKRQRKIMNPAFHRSMPVKKFGSVVKELITVIDQESESVPITTRMKSMTLDILGLAAFDFQFESLKGDPQGWTATYNQLLKGLFNPWVNVFAKMDFILNVISPERRRISQATLKFNGMLDGLAEKRRDEILAGENSSVPESEKDLLTLMIEADIREKGTASIEELRHNIALFFLAGHDTTAHTLVFCLYNLAKNKHIQKKTRAEVLHILGDEPTDIVPTVEEMKQMTYMDMLIKENLRKSGPVDKIMTRVTQEDIQLGDQIIQKGTPISIDVSALHLSPKNWANPNQFIPERFEEGGEYDKNVGTTYAPFSGGSRQCLGINFSLTEQKVVLSMLLRKYEIDVPEDSMHYDQVIFDKPFQFAPHSLNLKFTKRY